MMKPTLLDTDTVSHFIRRNPTVVSWASRYMLKHGALQLSIITYYESLSGLLYKDARQQMGQFEALVRKHHIVQLDEKSVNESARIEANLRRRGLSIGPTDTLIAGIAISKALYSPPTTRATLNE